MARILGEKSKQAAHFDNPPSSASRIYNIYIYIYIINRVFAAPTFGRCLLSKVTRVCRVLLWGASSKFHQLFSDPGKKGTLFWGRPFLVGQPPKNRGKRIGATEQLSFRRLLVGTKDQSAQVEDNQPLLRVTYCGWTKSCTT